MGMILLKQRSKLLSLSALAIFCACNFFTIALAGWNPATRAPNNISIANTRHNLTQSWAPLNMFMDEYRNNYGEVCVYCHTPHGASGATVAPLWNRTKPAGIYTVYSAPTTLGSTVTQPGESSLTCMSCHDGTIAIDSVINMPGSGGYSAAQETVVNSAFLDSWSGAGPTGNHAKIFGDPANDCNRCHHENPLLPSMDDFAPFLIGTDLRNDHPIGIAYPATGPNVDFKAPTATTGNLRFFDTNGSGHADANEIRLQNSGEGFEVECISCHDPHGVPSGGVGSQFIPSFLRVSNTDSVLCLSCHTK